MKMKKKKIKGTAQKPRLRVFKSLVHIYAQMINDDDGVTICSASTLDPDFKKSTAKLKKAEKAKLVGELIGKRAVEKGLPCAVFDKGAYIYHGRIAAVADGARSAGLKF